MAQTWLSRLRNYLGKTIISGSAARVGGFSRGTIYAGIVERDQSAAETG